MDLIWGIKNIWSLIRPSPKIYGVFDKTINKFYSKDAEWTDKLKEARKFTWTGATLMITHLEGDFVIVDMIKRIKQEKAK